MTADVPESLRGFSARVRQVDGRTLEVFEAGEGPPVVVMHEMPALTDAVAGFCRHLVDEGFFVVAPRLLGRPGGGYGMLRNLSAGIVACISREFAMLAADGHSPIVDTLRALCRQVSDERGGRPVGAIGMCLTGNFALALAVDPVVAAPVLSQPSLPLPLTARMRRSVHASDEEVAAVRHRCEASGLEVLGLRFTRDVLCPGERFETLRAELGEGFEGIEIPSGPDSEIGIGRLAHSVLTRDLVDRDGHPTEAARRRVVEFLRRRL